MQLFSPQHSPKTFCRVLPRRDTQGKAASLEAEGWASAPSPQELAQQHLIRLRRYCLSQHPLQNFPESCKGARTADDLSTAGRLRDCLGLQHRKAP